MCICSESGFGFGQLRIQTAPLDQVFELRDRKVLDPVPGIKSLI
jgi:hypothetical protein